MADIPQHFKTWIARLVRKCVVRGRAASGVYSTDGHRAAPTEPETGLAPQRFGLYGIASEAPDGTEVIILAVNGGASNRVSVAELPQNAPDLEPGEVCIWSKHGQRVHLTKDGDVVVLPASGRSVLLGSADGAAVDAVVTLGRLNQELGALKDWLNSHTHVAPMGGGTTSNANVPLLSLSCTGSPNVSAKKP